MLRIYQNTNPAGAMSYYSTADYYTEGQESPGQWRGQAAQLLGLSGQVKKAEWDALCQNLDPRTGKKLTLRQKQDRTVGYDFNFNVPKSLSILEALTDDPRIREAFRASVDETMREAEQDVKTRVRKGNRNAERVTGNLVWGEFIHDTSRPVDGIPDCNLHAHLFAFNITFDSEENAWKAGQFRDLKRDASYFQWQFHAKLAKRVQELGYAVERTKDAWEVVGIDKVMRDKFSLRTQQIEAKAKEKGIEHPDDKAALAAKTRESKEKGLSSQQLRMNWLARLTKDEWDTLEKVAKREHPVIWEGRTAKEAAAHAIAHAFVRSAVVPERKLMAEALRFGVGQVTREEIQAEFQKQGVIFRELKGRSFATTQEVLAEESRMIDFARTGRGACQSLVGKNYALSRDWLNEEQRKAVQHVWESPDRVVMIRGVAGVGKTTLMEEAVEGIEACGTRVFTFAPSAQASRKVLRQHFVNADTVAMFLKDQELQKSVAGQVIWIDEAGLLSTRDMVRVFDLASKLDARIVLSGDQGQHASVERGGVLGLLQSEAGIVAAEVKEIQRQKGSYKEAVRALSEGDVEDGLTRLDQLNWIIEDNGTGRNQRLAQDYLTALKKYKSFDRLLVVSPTHAEGDAITQAIRQELQKSKRIGRKAVRLLRLKNANLTEAQRADPLLYECGDVLQFYQNAKGHKIGERVQVQNPATLPLDQNKRFQVYRTGNIDLVEGDLIRITASGRTLDKQHKLENGDVHQVKQFTPEGHLVLDNNWVVDRDFGHIDYGYVVTSHASQGRTVDQVFIGQSSKSFPASSKEQLYVSASRAKERLTIYTDDKKALMESVSKADMRMSATALLSGINMRERMQQRQRHLIRLRLMTRNIALQTITTMQRNRQMELSHD